MTTLPMPSDGTSPPTGTTQRPRLTRPSLRDLSSHPCPRWCGIVGHRLSANSSPGLSIKTGFGQRIDFSVEDGPIAINALFVAKCRNRRPTSFSSAGSLSGFGMRCSPGSGLLFPWLLGTNSAQLNLGRMSYSRTTPNRLRLYLLYYFLWGGNFGRNRMRASSGAKRRRWRLSCDASKRKFLFGPLQALSICVM